MLFDKNSLLLYAVTDQKRDEAELFDAVKLAVMGGATCVQLREKNLSGAEYAHRAEGLLKICRAAGVPLIINDDFEVALQSGADGVHLGQTDGSIREVRRLAPNDFIIGATAKTVEQAKRAECDGANYLGVGAVFPSPTKANAIRIDKKTLNEICSSVKIPAVAIGGINADNISELVGAKICGFAVVSAIFGAEDVLAAARLMRRRAEAILLNS